MQRYFIELAYHGASYCGWQKQPTGRSVQEALEDTFSMVLGQGIEITGCGRTDTGVHARQYFAHFNFKGDLPLEFLHRVNRLLDKDIVVFRLFPVHWDAHARFDAHYRSYEYHLRFNKDPFAQDTSYFFPYKEKPAPEAMQEAARQLFQYADFFPFCKSDHNAKTTLCSLYRSEWSIEGDDYLVFHIAANRFLRGMVRLIVGMCIQVGLNKLSLEELHHALVHRERLKRSLSAPPHGLFLTEIRYPFLKNGRFLDPPEANPIVETL